MTKPNSLNEIMPKIQKLTFETEMSKLKSP